MISNKPLKIFILFFIAVAMLLRPYAAYRLTNYVNFAYDSVKVNDVFQRLNKKKENHHATIERETKETFVSPAVRRLPYKKIDSFVASIFSWQHQVNTRFHLTLQFKPYLFLSRLQV